jgi:3'-5' exoribonuclease
VTGSPKRPPHCLVADLRAGDRVEQVFLIETSNFKQTRNNKCFIQAELRDRSGSIKGLRWEADRALFDRFQADRFILVTGRVEEFQQHLQIVIDAVRDVDESQVEVEFFLPRTTRDIDAMEAELHALVAGCANEDLKRLLEACLHDPEIRAGLRRAPAGKTLHHATIGGLLEHIVSLCRASDLLAKNYPQLDRDLLQTGAILHDIAKIRELAYARAFRYTDEGQLVGHIAIGVAWVWEKARALDGFPEALLTQVLHLIASHHGDPAHGAIKPPMTPEAIALHYLDNLDAKLALLETVQREQKLGRRGSGENWSDWHPAMGTRLFFQ